PGYDGPLDGHILDMTLAEPHLTLGAGAQELTFAVTARDQATWEMVSFGRIAMANLSIVDTEPVVTDTTTTWTAIPATITAVAADEVMFGQYRPGAVVDPVTLTYAGPGGVPDLTETWAEPGSTRLGEPTIASLGAAAGTAWLVDDAHQVVHHPTSAAVEGGTQRGLQAFDLATLAPVGEPLLFPVGAFVPTIALYRSDIGRAYYEASDGSMAWIQWDPVERRYLTGTTTIPFPATKRAMWDPVGQRALSIERRVPPGVDTRAYDQHQWLLHVLTEDAPGTWSVVSHVLPGGPTGLNQNWYRPGIGGLQRTGAVAGDGSLVLTRAVNAQAPATLPPTLPLQRLVIGAEGVTVSEIPGSESGTALADRWGTVRRGPDGRLAATRASSSSTGAPAVVQGLRLAGGAIGVEGPPVSVAPSQVVDEWAFDPVDGTLWGASSTTRDLVAVRDGRVIGRQHHPALHSRNALVVVGADQDVYAQTMVGEDQFSFEMARFDRLGSSPGVTTQPSDRTVTLGLGQSSVPATFTAAAEGTPAPSYRWQSAPAGATRFADVAGATGPTLEVDATVGDDGTRYRVVVGNAAGETVSDEVLLTVLAAPAVTAQPPDVAAVEGDDATFGLAATGNPQPAIQWQRYSGGFWVDLADATDPFLTVEDTNVDMDGTRIRARLHNDVATAYTRTATLTVAGRPDGPVTVVGGDLDWGVRESFRRYITGSIAHGEIAVSDGATVDEDGTFRFPAETGSVVDGVVEAGFGGALRFTGHDGTGTPPGVPALDLTISAVRVSVAGDTGTLVADVASRGLDDGAIATYDDVTFAQLDLAAVTPTPVEGGLHYAAVTAALTEDGSAAFADFYAPGDPLDALDLTLLLGDAAPPRTEAESFVTAALTDLVAGEPSATEVAAAVAALEASPSRSAYLATLVRSDPWLEAVVDRLYVDTLGRPADPAGAAFWVERLRSGSWSVARVAASFYSSDEYLAGAGGGTVATWVDDLYLTLLGRPADADGRAYWVGEAARSGRGAVALRFFQSAESARARVAGLYDALLGRTPSPADVAYWGPVVVRRGDLALAVALAASPEYLARARLRFP
ncbi:MAG TPA: HtaA domain-containing protein, partial [Iamia sp.]